MVAQHRAAVFGAEEAAALQHRDNLGGERVELRRQQRRHDVEPVRGAAGEPVLDQIGDLLRRPGGDVMAARAGEIAEQLPQGRLVAPHQVDDHLGAAARRLDRAGVGEIRRRQRPVERQMREVVPAEAARQPLAPDLRVGQLVHLAHQALRLGFGGGDHRAETGQDQHLVAAARPSAAASRFRSA